MCLIPVSRADLFLRTLMLWELTIAGKRDELPQHEGKTAAGIRRGKSPHPSPCQRCTLPLPPACLLASTPTSEGASTLSCPRGSQHMGQCRFPPLPLPSAAPSIMARLVSPCSGGRAAGAARGAQACFATFRQTWPLGAWALLSNALCPPGHGQSGWGRSSCSCNRLPVPYGLGATRLSAGCDR